MKMTMRVAALASVTAVVLASFVGGCGGPDADLSDEESGSSGSSSSKGGKSKGGKSSSGNGASFGESTKDDDVDKTTYEEGSACPAVGSVTFCWTGAEGDRGRGTCRDGTQTCEAQGEFPVWSACKGQVTDCDRDAGPAPVVCEGDCIPGATRWCDAPTFCTWGKQQCLPSRTWGQCKETSDTPKGCERPGSRQYVPSCCVAAGECCQDPSFTDKGANFPSAGKCDGIACPGSMSKR